MHCPKCNFEASVEDFGTPPRCPNCGVYTHKVFKSAPETVRTVSEHGSVSGGSATRMWKIALFSLLSVGIVLSGIFFGKRELDRREDVAKIESELRLSSAHVVNLVSIMDSNSSTTFAEYFRKSANSIEAIDASILRVSVLESSSDQKALANEYMKSCQELIRASNRLMREILNYSNAQDRLERAKNDSDSDNSYTRQRAVSRQIEALNESLEIVDRMKAAKLGMEAAVEKTKSLSEKMPFDKTALIDPAAIEFLLKK